ncbi:hypothetical protein TWF970_001186 [Orbilia oligospora]|uniref:Uncharacterized protein n=1 Tax=Orbilia oligospora TaxID=2813651 RepID=A0A7C8REF1_ORBOL|nr:hypothetical protein TWF970_001186 [Orbilia oligospora]
MDSAMSIHPKTREEYTIGWICALPKEQIAAVPMLDQRHSDPKLYKSPNDTNAYFFGSIGRHDVVITCLPLKCYGTNRTAKAAAQMLNNFPSIKITFMVGIGAGIPTKVELGDVVVGTEWAQWDFGKVNGDGVFEHTGRKCFPPDELLSVMSKIRTEHSLRGYTQIPEYIQNLGMERPHLASEYCLRPDATEKSQSTLNRNPEDIRIHYGLIASGNQVVKDAKVRDDINKRLEGQVLCLEMEAAGLVGIPAVVIRGICDYADSNKNDDWQEYAAAVAAACAKEFITSIEPAAAREIQISREDFDRVVNEIAILRGSLAGDEERKILEWITPIDDSAQHNDFFNRRQPGTGNWFLNSSKYQNWLHTPKSILYCPGIPGAGKTILTSVVINDLLDRYSYDPAVGIAYIYFNFQGSAHLRIDDLLSNLLKQLLRIQNTLPKYIRQLYNRYRGGGRPSRAEIMDSIHAISAAYSRFFIIIDALDEYEERSEFLEKVFEIHELQQLGIFATSRPIPDIKDKFKGKETYTECEIRASDGDVRLYLEGQILRLGTNAIKSNKEIIKNRISGLVQGMFLLAHLQFEAIKGMTTLKAIRQILGGFGSGGTASNSAYDSTYRSIMERIRGNDKQSATTLKVLAWIACASRRLTKAELQHAIAVEPEAPTGIDNDNISDIEDLISPCLGLVTIDKESNIVRLIHYTAQEYFDRTKQYWFSNPHDYLAETSIIYLSYDNFKSGPCLDEKGLEERVQSNAFYIYAAHNIGYHIRRSSPERTETLSSILHLLLNDNLRLACVQVPLLTEQPNSLRWRYRIDGMQALHVAAYYGLTRAVGVLLAERRPNLEAKENYGQTPLSLAAAGGHKDVVELLIKGGANLEAKDRYNETPLYVAISNRRETVTKLLIESGGDVSIKNRFNTTLIKAAIKAEHEGITRLLIERMMDVEVEGQYPLIACIAARYGYEDTMKQLIERGVDLNATVASIQNPFRGSSPLWLAIEAQHEGVIGLMVNAGVDLEQRHGHNWETPIFFVARRGYEAVVRALARRANLEAKDGTGRTPLLIAAKNGHRGCVEILLEKGALVTPDVLWAAFDNQNEDIAMLLSAAVQDPEAEDYIGRTPLLINSDAWESQGEKLMRAAVLNGYESTIRLLIQSKVKIKVETLWVAVSKAYKLVAGLLNLNAEFEAETIPIALLRREEIVRLILENVEDLKVQIANQLVSCAMSMGGGYIAELLIDKVADLKNVDKRQMALYYAVVYGSEYFVRNVVETGVDLEYKDEYDYTPLMAAIHFDNNGLVEFLILKGASLETKTKDGQAPLLIAARRGRVKIIELLIHNGANLESKNNESRTPLSIAAKNGPESTVKLLVEKGANWRTADENGDTPLSLARKVEHKSIVQFLTDLSICRS